MEHLVNLRIRKLPEGVYLAASDDIPGLVAQGSTIAETVEIAGDVAQKLIASRREHNEPADIPSVGDAFAR